MLTSLESSNNRIDNIYRLLGEERLGREARGVQSMNLTLRDALTIQGFVGMGHLRDVHFHGDSIMTMHYSPSQASHGKPFRARLDIID
jgi:hypothetical protein